ncbi:MAG TPA: phosphoribosyltransferase family protein [Patescibacteria group bacterium]|nr:phosphoribosyltransferase family protein [Candidatus Saccharimonadales bacterium]HSX46466.1 phosphoribosyltransferase family protein [Patescibacteria group bacterium]
MYYKSRAEAGRQLAAKLTQYNNQQCAVIALNAGGVLVGAQIAMRLHANLLILANESIILPGETEPLATLTASSMSYNSSLYKGEVEEMVGEYHGLIEEQRLQKFHHLNTLMTAGGNIDPKYLKRHVVILVSDALQTGASLDIVTDFLKPIKLKKLVIVTPLASIKAVDKMHLIGDEIYCLSVGENLMEANHYYDDNTIPSYENALKIIRNISMSWELAH